MKQMQDPIQRLFPTGYCYELKNLVHLAWPTVFLLVFQFLLQPVAVIFCGHLGKTELDAVGLANTLINVIGTSIASGMCTACDTLLSQTYGSKNRHKLGIILQRSILIILLSVLPCWAVYLNTESLMLLIGQDKEVSRLTGQYMMTFLPGLPFIFAYYPVLKYMLNQNIVYPTLCLSVVPVLLDSLLHFILVNIYRYGILGSAIAQACSYSTFLPLSVGYIYFSKSYEETWSGWHWECLLHWKQFYKLGGAGVLMVCIEWWSFEIGTFLAGILGTTELGSQSVIMQTYCLLYAIGMGIGIAANIRVGHYLGGNNPDGAKTVYRTAITLVCGVNFIVGVLIATLCNFIPQVFTNVPEVIDLTASLLPILGLYILFDGMTAVSTGILRGCGRQDIGAGVVFVSYILLALPTGISLMFLTSLRLSGLWWSLATAMIINSMVYQVILSRTDWVHEAQEARSRVTGTTTLVCDEQTALLEEEASPHCVTAVQRPSTIIPPRKTSFIYPNQEVEAKLAEQILRGKGSDVSWTKILVYRLLLLLAMISILIVGLLFRVSIAPIFSNSTEESVRNETTAQTT